jgi:hypothetical protein
MAKYNYSIQPLGLGDKTIGQTMKETVEREFLVEGHSFEDIVVYRNEWDWEKFTREGEF